MQRRRFALLEKFSSQRGFVSANHLRRQWLSLPLTSITVEKEGDTTEV
jgi:hypothetical protein